MATPATARRSEPHSSKLRPDLDSPPSPLRSTHQVVSRASTPRPSISPLSTASKPNRSPIATRDIAMTEAEVQGDAEVDAAIITADAEVGEEPDDRSSGLSEPEDEQDEAERQHGAMVEREEPGHLRAQKSLDVDSEAETERLEQTPQKLRKHADSIGMTPSKLGQAARAEDELSNPPSPLPVGVDAASSTSTIATLGKKRKRSDTADSSLTSADSELGESPRKRSHESPVEPEVNEEEDNTATNGIAVTAVEGAVGDIAVPEESHGLPMPTLPKGVKGKKGKQKGRKTKDIVAEIEPDHIQAAATAEQEPSEEAAARTEEHRQYKTEATSRFEDVAKQFTAFRDRLYNERLASMTAELNLLSQPDVQHPEYIRQVASVNARRDKQIREANAYYYYRLNSTRQRTLGDRSQLHSQYFQRVRELREAVLYSLGEDWYNIQKERRQQENDDAYVFKFPTKKSVQIRQQAKYNQEVSVLSGVAKYVGFPAAPDIGGAEVDSMEDDLKAMKIAKRAPQSTTTAHLQQRPQTTLYPSLPTVSAQNERLAHEQFIEQNAWAQPQRPIHTHGTPNLTHTPDWAEPGPHPPHPSARNLIRNLSGQAAPHRAHSPFTTPMPQRRTQPPAEQSSSGTVAVDSDGAELPSSVLAAPPTTSDRMHVLHHQHQQQQQQQQGSSSNQASPLVVHKYRQQRQQHNGTSGGAAPELTGLRNISNISGASTIDAPPSTMAADSPAAEKLALMAAAGREYQHQQPMKTRLPAALLAEASAPQQVFDTSQLHRHGGDGGAGGFRAQEGAFGTPAPLQAGTAGGAP